jgi:hypothetical protein
VVVALYSERDVLVPIAPPPPRLVFPADHCRSCRWPLRIRRYLWTGRIDDVAGQSACGRFTQIPIDPRRYAIRRVRRKAPGALIVVSLFGNAVSIEGLEQHGELDVVTQSFRATIERIVAAAIRLETENDLPDSGLPPSVAAIEESPRKDAATAI